ncbi:GNAT family N-acetyltransferase [Aquimarina sp. W85]|uniref:GNAT family N-acetyltransferase n=1 Tax=Aquimarina rhodophyticola TaxID=3342246 RepID=UPI00366FA577
MLNTKRCTLRPMESKDLHAIHKLHILEEVDQYNTLGIPESIHTTARILSKWIENMNAQIFYGFVIEDKVTNEYIGIIGLQLGNLKYSRGEVWYKLMPEQWNKGFGTEVTKEIVKFGFKELKLHRIEAGCACDNLSSIRVLEKSGFLREGKKRKVLPLKSGWSDGFDYAILHEDWIKNVDSTEAKE